MIDFIKILPKRHLLKTLSYRVVSSFVGFVLIWSLFGISVAQTFILFEIVWKCIQYYIHEKIWYKFIKFGVRKVEDPVKPDFRIMDSISTEVSENVTTTGPKRLVYTKKTA